MRANGEGEGEREAQWARLGGRRACLRGVLRDARLVELVHGVIEVEHERHDAAVSASALSAQQ